MTGRLATPAEERELERLQTKFKLSERDWQTQVIQLARLHGWRVFHPLQSKGSEPGWPDLAMVRSGRLFLVELKTDDGRLSPAQREWFDQLGQVAAAAGDAIHVDVWRPADFDRAHRLLQEGR